jgi:type I restriction enzyme M protein
MEELFKCAFAKHYIVKHKIEKADASKAYRQAFAISKREYPGVFDDEDEIQLDPVALEYVDSQFGAIDLENSRADIFAEIYETFGEGGIKASEGQFFTPRVAIELLLRIVDPSPDFEICDPACGSGGFLIEIAKYWNANGEKPARIAKKLHGVEKDLYLTRFARGRLGMFLDSIPEIICGDSLSGLTNEEKPFKLTQYDAVFTNPPFGSKIVAADEHTLGQFKLGRRWTKNGSGFMQTAFVNNGTSPQILFLELCLNILKPGGYLAAILPESMLSSKSYSYVVQFLHENANLIAVVGMPESLFKTSGKTGTHTKTVALVARKKPVARRGNVFFAEAKWCGHDSRARRIDKNDIPVILENFRQHTKGVECSFGHLGVSVNAKDLGLNLAPRRFEFNILRASKGLSEQFRLVRFGDLMSDGVVEVRTGDEIGKLAYGTGDIPFVRTSDISNWEIKADPKHRVSKEIFEEYRSSQDVQAEDILMVRDGTYLIGTVGMISEGDLPLLYQSHIYKIRVLNREKLSPYVLLASLSSELVRKQVKSYCVSQDIIDSLGDKLFDIVLPLPKDSRKNNSLALKVKQVIQKRAEAKTVAQEAIDELGS